MPKTSPNAEPDRHADVAALSYEQAREELVEVVRTLEAGGTSLEESLALWERGEALAARCQAWLDGAREKLDAVVTREVTAESVPAGAADESEELADSEDG